MQRGRDKFLKYRSFILFFVRLFSVFPNKFLNKLLIFFRGTKGNKGLVIRYILLKCLAKSIGENVSVHPGVYLFSPEGLSIGNNVSIQPMCYIDASGEIEIGNDVSIAHGVTLLSTSHSYSDLNLVIKDQELIKKKTVINSNVWLGAKATILCGVTIETGSIVGAGAVVCTDIRMNSVVGGVPAKLIKKR